MPDELKRIGGRMLVQHLVNTVDSRRSRRALQHLENMQRATSENHPVLQGSGFLGFQKMLSDSSR